MKTPDRGRSGSPRKPNLGRGGNRRFRPDGTPIDREGRPFRGGDRTSRSESTSSGEGRRDAGGPRRFGTDAPGGRDSRRTGPGAAGGRRGGPGEDRRFRSDVGDDRRGTPASERRGGPASAGRFRNEGEYQRPRPEGRPQRQEAESPRGARPPRQRPAGMQIRGDLLYGRNAVRESLRAGKREHRRLFVAEGVREDERVQETIDLARSQDVLLERVPRMLLDDLTKGGNHQGVALESGEFAYAELEDIIERPGTILIMDHLNDPQNFGTLLRAADASGIAGVVIPQDRSVSVTPAVVNSSAGAVEHLQVALTPNLARALDKIEESGRWIVGLDEDETGNNIFTTDVPTPVGLVIGAEGSGLSPIVRKRCQVIFSLPMRGHVDSLNAATAGSIVLYDLLRRQMQANEEF